jgi:FAD/FMN-containing dehydrogenase
VIAALPDSKRSLQVIEDGCVPVEKLGTYVSEVQGAADDAGIDIVAFGHAGDGHLHVNALVDTTSEDFEHRVTTLFERVTEIVLQLGGTPSGEHGDGRLRAGTLRRLYGPEILELFRRVKLAFDPHGTMNPGVVLPCDDASPIQALKVGPDAASISAHIAAGLRRLERTGGWGIPKLELLAGEKSR